MFQEDIKYPWFALRSVVTTDDTALALFRWSDWPSSNTFNCRENIPTARSAKIMFYGGNAADKDCAFILYGRYRVNGPIVPLLTGIFVLGARAVGQDPITKITVMTHYWADQITITTGQMDDEDTIQNTGENDEIAAIVFPLQGVEELYLELNLDGGSAACAKAGAIITGIYE